MYVHTLRRITFSRGDAATIGGQIVATTAEASWYTDPWARLWGAVLVGTSCWTVASTFSVHLVTGTAYLCNKHVQNRYGLVQETDSRQSHALFVSPCSVDKKLV